MRLVASHAPLTAPCTRNASMAYAEQVGVYRQPPMAPNKNVCAGEIVN
jgi:hypothetical protein